MIASDKYLPVEDDVTISLRSTSSKTYVAYDPTHQQGQYKTLHYYYDSNKLTLEPVKPLKQPGTFVQTYQNKQPKSYTDAMTRSDAYQWYDS
jgi:hypothetical protein